MKPPTDTNNSDGFRRMDSPSPIEHRSCALKFVDITWEMVFYSTATKEHRLLIIPKKEGLSNAPVLMRFLAKSPRSVVERVKNMLSPKITPSREVGLKRILNGSWPPPPADYPIWLLRGIFPQPVRDTLSTSSTSVPERGNTDDHQDA